MCFSFRRKHPIMLLDLLTYLFSCEYLHRWLTHHIVMLYCSDNPDHSVFEWNQETGKVRLRNDVTIHMYLSTAPCGDASAYAFEYVFFISLIFIYFLYIVSIDHNSKIMS